MQYSEIIDGIQDLLGHANPMSRKVIQQQKDKDEELEIKRRKDELKKRNKETMKAIKEYTEQ